jgi:peptide/nickel transport system ATP-binding protein
MTAAPVIAAQELTVTFTAGRHVIEAVRQVDFEVGDGEVFGLVGESGSGKSTVLRALTGLHEDWRGRLDILGEAQGRRRSKAFHRQVQMVFQDPYSSLHPRHTVDRILAEPLAIHGIPDAAERIEKALVDVGLDRSYRFRFPHQLSGGQRQRVAIARAIILEPRILLLDEPTSALDVSVQAEILNLLSRLKDERGLTMMLVSHNLAVVAHMGDRLAVMRRGEIVERLDVGQLRRGEADHPYTRQLLIAAKGYDRQLADTLLE